MICSEKERESCNVEKLGCEGCYYNKPRGEEIKEYLKEIISNTYAEGKAIKLNQALKYIDYLEQENSELKIQRDYYKREYSLYNKTLEEAGKALTKK